MRKLVFAALAVVTVALSSGAGTAAAESAPSGGGVNALDANRRVVTLWTETGFNGTGLVISGPVRASGRVCTETTDDIDQRVNLDGTIWFRNVESVNDNPDAHCDWQLIDANGVHSTWVEGSIGDLRNLGSGWRNRAVAIRFT